jgi:PAS domain S-box-containing protein
MAMIRTCWSRQPAAIVPKRSQKQPKQSTEDLRQIKTALDAHAIVAVTDPQGRITYVNDKFCEISKYSREELLGQDHRLINSGYHSKAFMHELWTTIGRGGIWQGEIRNRAKDGSFYWVSTTIVPCLDAEGKPERYISIRTDISERKRAEEEVRKLNDELEERVQDRTAELQAMVRELEAFAYSVSHDLRAPLRHIDGYLQLFNTTFGPQLPKDSGYYLETIANSTRRMSRLIDELLLYSRSGRAEMRSGKVPLGPLVDEAIHALEPETVNRNIVWKRGPLPEVKGDRTMLLQVLINLISNSVKYTRPRDLAEIEIGSIEVAPGETAVFVRDNGVGFDMKYADKLFGVFQRLHLAEDFEGTGIGLANVRRIVARHGGRTWAEGQVESGATFYFTIPDRDRPLKS